MSTKRDAAAGCAALGRRWSLLFAVLARPMNTSLSNETTVLDAVEAPKVPAATVALYIDADNAVPVPR
jgi:hypothetical protein